jgi:2-polyprenyl-3-methyl-5-hydroxy-6-metoxy-1,4-benzoquinol methylase
MSDKLEHPVSEAQTQATASSAEIARYYDDNTQHFLRLGGSGEIAAIHRAIWAPGVTNKAQAFAYLNRLVADSLAPLLKATDKPLHVLDLGCGVGGTATWLATELGIQVTGITLSEAQVNIARARAQTLGLHALVAFKLGSFDAMPPLRPAHGAFAIESFVHASDASKFFKMAADHIKPGGRLMICDDFLDATSPPAAAPWITRFRRGWHLNSLLPSQTVIDAASRAGFRLLETHDLSPFIRGFHPALLGLLTQLTRLPLPWAYWKNLSGGTALQFCLLKGWTRYQTLLWERETE